MVATLQIPFSEAQLELLKLFNTPLTENDLTELRAMLLEFKFRKFQEIIERDTNEKGYSQNDFDEMKKGHERTAYLSNHKIIANKTKP